MGVLRKFFCSGIVLVIGICWLEAQTSSTDLTDDELLARGRSIYNSLCQRCHGSDGDSTDYPGITPLAGIAKRIDQTEIPRLSAPFVGRNFEGQEALSLVRYLSSLKGAKGFDQPGFLFSPYLLDKKKGYTEEYRILDLRREAAFRAQHISEAVVWPVSDTRNQQCLMPAGDIRDALRQVDVSAETFIVLYDDQVSPRATCVWWNIIRSGHERVAILDGGWDAWTDEGYSFIGRSTSGEATVSQLSSSGGQDGSDTAVILSTTDQPARQISFDLKKAITDSRVAPASQITEYFDEIDLDLPGEYRVVNSQEKNLSVLTFLLHLLDYRVSFDPSTGALLVETGDRTH